MTKITLSVTTLLAALSLTACGNNEAKTTVKTIAAQAEVAAVAIASPTTIEGHWAAYLTDLTNNHILPSYQNFATSSEQFNQSARQFCAQSAPTADDLSLVQQAWLQASQNWQTIQWLKVGPVVDSAFRIQYWPDNNKAVKRAIARHLQEPTTLTASLIEKKNVGGQGLPAAEYLLYPSSSQDSLLTSESKVKRCELLTAVSQNLSNISADLNQQWQPSGANYANTLISGTGEFNGVKDAVEELMSNWYEHIEKVSNTKTLQSIGEATPGLPKTAENHLSDSSLANLKTNIETFSSIYNAGNGHGLGTVINEFFNAPAVDQAMNKQLTTSLATINKLQGSYTKILSDDQQRLGLINVAYQLLDLQNLFSEDFVKTTKLNTGFNSNDGD